MTRRGLWDLDEILSEQHEPVLHVGGLRIWRDLMRNGATTVGVEARLLDA